MHHIVTLIAHPQVPDIDEATVAKTAATLAAFGTIGAAETLAEGFAVDIPLTIATPAADRSAIWSALRETLRERPIDIVVQAARERRKRLLIADMDSTMIEQECIDELAAEIGIRDAVARITERAMRGEVAFEPALRERVALLKGLDARVVDRLLERVITLTPGGRTLLATMRAAGAHTALVSGGFTVFTGPIAQRIGFHEHQANRLDLDNGRFVGTVDEPILGRAAKREALLRLSKQHAIAADATLAVGDGANDLDMLQAAGLGVAFRAKPAVAAAAHARIDHGDLTALLFLQGYRREAFVDPDAAGIV